jgi:AraC-like DNA-binding protein
MSAAAPLHRVRVTVSPCKGIYGARIESGRHFGRHTHDAYGFGFLEHGAHRSASGRGSVDAFAGDVITTNPGEVHDGRPLGGASRRWCIVYAEPQAMASFAGTKAEIARPVIRDARLLRAARRLFRRMERGEGLACEEALAETCTLVMARHGTMPPPRAVPADVSRVRERLADDLLDPPSLAEMAALTGLSRYQVLRRFESAYGLPPHAWLLQQRAERARGLIRDGWDLAAAAAASGFADQSHMTRVFTLRFGFTPGAWRKALQ